MTHEELKIEVEKVLSAMIDLIGQLDAEEINIVPFEGSWTAGELAEHVILSAGGFYSQITGPITDTDRDPEQMAAEIKSIFLNFDIKMKSPEFIVPPAKFYEKTEILGTLEKQRDDFNKAIPGMDLSKTCTAFSLPRMGYLTRYECISFVIYHTQRHVHQLKNISAAIRESEKI